MKKFALLTITAILTFGGSLSTLAEETPAVPSTVPTTQKATKVSEVDQPFEQILKQNYVDLTNWVKESGGSVEGVVKDGVKQGGAFKEQSPLYIREVILWEIWGNLIQPILSVVFLIFSGFLGFYFSKKADRNNGNSSMAASIAGWVICGASLIYFLASGVPHLEQAVKATVSPRVVIVEKIKELAN